MSKKPLQIEHLDLNYPHNLYMRYDRQTKPQPVYIYLHLEDGKMWADWDHGIGGGMPGHVYHGVVRRYPIPPFLAYTANLVMDDIASLAQIVLDGSHADYDDQNNLRGYLDDAAINAEDHIERRLRHLREQAAYEVCWEADWEWFADSATAYLKSGSRTDEEIVEWVVEAADETEMNDRAAVIEREDIVDWMIRRRDELKEEDES